jgi:hypothetical protein
VHTALRRLTALRALRALRCVRRLPLRSPRRRAGRAELVELRAQVAQLKDTGRALVDAIDNGYMEDFTVHQARDEFRAVLDAARPTETTGEERARPVPLPDPNVLPHTDGWEIRDNVFITHVVDVRPMTDDEIRAERLTQPAGDPWLARCTCGAEMLPLYPGEANAWEQSHLGTKPARPADDPTTEET